MKKKVITSEGMNILDVVLFLEGSVEGLPAFLERNPHLNPNAIVNAGTEVVIDTDNQERPEIVNYFQSRGIRVNTGDIKIPSPPSGLSAIPTPLEIGSITLNWFDNSQGLYAFEIWRRKKGALDFLHVHDTNVAETTWQNDNLGHGTTYEYKVRVKGFAGAVEFSNIAEATTPSADLEIRNTNSSKLVATGTNFVWDHRAGISYLFALSGKDKINSISACDAGVNGVIDLSSNDWLNLVYICFKNALNPDLRLGSWVNQTGVLLDVENAFYEPDDFERALTELERVNDPDNVISGRIFNGGIVLVDLEENPDIQTRIDALTALGWTIKIVNYKLLSATIGERIYVDFTGRVVANSGAELWFVNGKRVVGSVQLEQGDLVELYHSDHQSIQDIHTNSMSIRKIDDYDILVSTQSVINLDIRANYFTAYELFIREIRDYCTDNNIVESKLIINIKDGRNFDLNEDEYDLTILREELKNDYGVDIQLYNIKWSVKVTAGIGSTQPLCKGAGIIAGVLAGDFVGETDIYSFIYDTNLIDQLTISLTWGSGRRIHPKWISKIDKFAFRKVSLAYVGVDPSVNSDYDSWIDLLSNRVLRSNWIVYEGSQSESLFVVSNPIDNNVTEDLFIRTDRYRHDPLTWLDNYVNLKRLSFQDGLYSGGANPNDYTFENRGLEYFNSIYASGGHLTFQNLSNFQEFHASGGTQFSGKTIKGNMPLLHTIDGDQYTTLTEVDTANMPSLRYLNFRNINNLTIATATYNDLIELRGWYNSAIDYSLFKSLIILDTRQGGYGQELDNPTHNTLLTQLNSSTLTNTELKLQGGPIFQTRNKPLDSVNYNLCRDLSENKNFNITSLIVEYNSVNTICYVEQGTRNIRRKSDDLLLPLP